MNPLHLLAGLYAMRSHESRRQHQEHMSELRKLQDAIESPAQRQRRVVAEFNARCASGYYELEREEQKHEAMLQLRDAIQPSLRPVLDGLWKCMTDDEHDWFEYDHSFLTRHLALRARLKDSERILLDELFADVSEYEDALDEPTPKDTPIGTKLSSYIIRVILLSISGFIFYLLVRVSP